MHIISIAVLFLLLVSVAYVIFWGIGLFQDSPPRRRRPLVALAAAGWALIPLAHGFGSAIGIDTIGNVVLSWLLSVAVAINLTGAWNVWSLVMLVACLVSVGRLLTFRRGTSKHRIGYAALSWLIVSALTAVAVKLAFGIQPPPGPVEAFGVAAFAFGICRHRGDLAHLLREIRCDLGRVLKVFVR
jgi:hypothetical protein